MNLKNVLLTLLATINVLKSQSVRGIINDTLNNPVEFVPVALLNLKDSSIVKGTNTIEKGVFSFESLKPGNYLIRIDAMGYLKTYAGPFKVDTLNLTEANIITLHSSALNLKEVSVSVMKKLVEFKNGNIVINIENSPLSVGNSLYDLLSRLPTVSIIDDVISIQGKSGARVLIDDRLQQLSGQQLISLLKTIQASTVDKIEILKNPPAKYDAAGMGFINVRTKKLKMVGFSGSINLSYSQGFYANLEGGLSLNYKGRNYTVFSSLNCGNNEKRYTSIFKRRITYNDRTTEFNQVTSEKDSSLYGAYTIGADWFLNSRSTIGFRIDGNQGTFVPDRKGQNNLSDGSLGYNRLLFSSVRPNSWHYINYNLNAEHKLDSLGTLLRVSLDYSPNTDLNRGDFDNLFVDSMNNYRLPSRSFKSDNNLQFIIYSGKIDFEKQLSKSLKLEAGIKGNEQNMVTNFNFNNKDATTGEFVVDTVFTNGFEYKERINAGYFSLSKDLKKFNFQFGLRGEHTAIDAGSTKGDIMYERNYFNLFPTANINYNPNEKHSIQFSYNRRINRPNYSAFNPYKYFVNLFVSFQGNPYMMPEYSDNIDLTHGYKSSFYNTVSFSKIKNSFFGYPIQNDSTKESLQTQANFANTYVYSYSSYLQKEIKKWYIISINGFLNYAIFSGDVEGKPYEGRTLMGGIYLNNQISLPNSYKIEATVNSYWGGNAVIYRHKGMYDASVGVRKNFLNNKLNVSLAFQDIFYSWVSRNTVKYENIDSELEATYDLRRIKTSITYNFGKIKVQRRDLKSNQEEKRRLEH